MKWLKIASLAVLFFILAIFALVGVLYSTRGTPTRTVHAFGDPAGPPSVADSVFTESLELLTHTDVRGGHAVELLLNGNGTYPRLWADLRSAKKSITLQLYYCEAGQVADSLKNILMERAGAKVKVLVLLDAFGSTLSDEYQDSLRAAGVRVAEFRPLKWYTLHKAQNRSHVRAIVIDDSVGYTGGFGVADYWLGDGHHDDQWRESNVRFTGPAVAQLQAAFSVAWAEATGELITGHNFYSAMEERTPAGTDAGLLFATPEIGSTPAERYLALLIAGARRTLYITNAYFVPDEDMQNLLIAAVKRGVDVRVLTAGKNTDVKTVRHAAHARYEKLLRGGVRIFEYRPAMLHAKTLVVDGLWSSVGSMNFDNRSLALNDESNLTIRDTVFSALLQRQFIDDLRHSNEFKADLFSQRSLFQKALDIGAGQLAKVL